MIGRSLTRTPVARYTALPMAGATGGSDVSPSPRMARAVKAAKASARVIFTGTPHGSGNGACTQPNTPIPGRFRAGVSQPRAIAVHFA